MQNPLPSSGAFSRRTFLSQGGFGLGAAALSQLFGASPLAASGGPLAGLVPQEGGIPPGVVGYPQFPPRIKRVIFLCMAGGPSHLETFDNKPKLVEMDGQPMPTSVTDGQPIAQLQKEGELKVLRPQYAFNRHGESGQEISDALPFTARMADKICILRGMKTEQINHDPAHSFMNTGTAISGRPSMGSWVTYGLGSECADLPGFVVLTSIGGRDPQPLNSRQWHNGFLPSRFQGVPFQSQGDPVHYVNSPPGMNPKRQRETIDAIAARVGAAAIRDTTYTQANITRVRASRAQLIEQLGTLGFRTWPSQANFVLAQPPNKDAQRLYTALKARHILVRYFDAPGLADKLRITVGTDDQNAELTRALETLTRASEDNESGTMTPIE